MLTEVLRQYGWAGLAFLMLAAAVWMVFTDRLVPGRAHRRALAAEKQRGDDWHAAWEAEVKRGEVHDAQMNEILAFVRRGSREAA